HAVGAVLARVGIVAHPHQRLGQQRDHHRDHLAAGETALAQVAPQPAAQPWQGLAERDDAVELAGATHLLPVGVVAVLLAPAGIAAGRLQVAVALAADPHVRPRRRDGEPADPVHQLAVGYPAAIGFQVSEPVAGTAAGDPRLVVADVAESGLFTDGGRFGDMGVGRHGPSI